MAHIPFGYDIIDGKAVVNEGNAEKLRTIFSLYLSGVALREAGAKVGLTLQHSSIGKMLRNSAYLGNDFYPAIIDKETFDKAEEERKKRAKYLNRSYDYSNIEEKPRERKHYHLGKVERKYDDPFKQASYAYSQIESEDKNG